MQYLEKRLVRKKDQSPASGILSSQPVLEDDMDDGSLIPASVTDDSSYVIYPAPSTNETLTTTRSFEDMVLVGYESDCEYDDN